MRSCDRGMRGWAGGPQAAAEPRDLGGSGAPGAVVPGEALIERVAPWWGIVRGVPGRGRIVGEELGYDGWFARRNDHPIRANIPDAVRVEGWGVYLEEPMVRAGVIDHLPRVHELMYLFGIFRAIRVTANIGMQLNEMTISEGAEHMRSGSPWVDEDVARVDAEIYLRRPPGYGLGYTIGNLQIQQLLGELRIRDGDAFDLKAFHDDFLEMGRMPVSLIRYEMLGAEDQVAAFWEFEPIPPAGPRP